VKFIREIFASILTLSSASSFAEQMVIVPNTELSRTAGPAERFSGAAYSDFIFKPTVPSSLSAGKVSFEPGARTDWHSHPLGQTLVVTSGEGWVQEKGGSKRAIRSGDVIWTPPGVKHWHGATPTSGMTHIAVQEMQDGKAADWYEKVADEEYRK
jgi:quercetin dioxygenase-like cupin family protein